MELQWDFNTGDTRTEMDDQEFGMSIIPVSTAKIPFDKWTEYQTKIAPISIWYSHYKNQGTVGIITGEISGKLECIDIDIKNDIRKTIIDEYNALIPDELLNKLLIQSTPSGGLHYIYRCPEASIEKSQKLALDTDKQVIIETRGEGSYFCTSIVNNKVLQGELDLLNLNGSIPVITPEERQFLLETARTLTRYFPTGDTKSKTGKPFVYSESAINDFNTKYDIRELFLRHNWSIVGDDDEKLNLLRNGSNANKSGTYFKATRTFFCFSTSTDFEPLKPYNNFQVLQVLEGKKDYHTTLRLLPSLGFQVESKPDKITADDIAKYLNDIWVRYDSFIQDLTLKGSIIEELDYNTLYIDLKKHFDKEIPRTRYEETIKSHYIQKINPIEDFILTNKDRHPVGTFEKWLDCLELKNKSVDKSIYLHLLKKWYVGMIAQAIGGPFANEFFLSLLSVKQGVGKTTFLRSYTLPKELHPFRKEHPISGDDDFKVLMSQALLIVDDEMDGRSFETVRSFKNILSNQEMTMRRKYDRRISTLKRRCSFAGSGNNIFIVKEFNDRRFIPIEIEKIYFDRLLELDYTDLFMEAYNLFISGFSYSYQQTDRNLLDTLYEDYIMKSDVDLMLDEYIMSPETQEDRYYITNLDIVTCLITKYPHSGKRINVLTIGKLMNERGFEVQRKGKQRTTCYVISKSSRIMEVLSTDSQSWRINYEGWPKLKLLESKGNSLTNK